MGGRGRLASGVPRAYPDHRRRVARAYRAAVAEIRERLGLNGNADVLLREYGRLVVELDDLAAQAEDLRGRPRRHRDAARVARRRVILRSQLIALERRLEERAPRAPRPIAELVREGRPA